MPRPDPSPPDQTNPAHHRFALPLLVTAASIMIATANAAAQCDGGWITDFASPGLARTSAPPTALASILWDPDGDGPLEPRLIVGGAFSSVNGVAANNIAQWDGTNWSPIGGGVNGAVSCFLIVSNDSGGNDLLVGGSFSTAGSTSVTGAARWDGSNWSRLGSTLPAGMGGAQVRGLTQLQDGRIVAVGRWGTSVPNVVALSAAGIWTSIAPTLPQTPIAVATTANGDLFVGGPSFTISGANLGGVVRWNGSGWSRVGSGVNGTVNVLTPLFNGDLAVGGAFTDFFAGIGNPGRIAIWNASGGPVNPGWRELSNGVNSQVRSIIELADRSLLVGGDFDIAGPGTDGLFSPRLARFNGSNWSGAGLGLVNSPAPAAAAVNTLTQLADGSVLVGGVFDSAGGLAALAIARFAPPIPPTIVEQPTNLRICPDAQASYTVVTTGEVSTYQWQYRTAATFNNWQPVLEGPNVFFGTYLFDAAGATAQSLTVTNTQGPWTDDFQFKVTASDGCNSVTSFPTLLSPQICGCSPADIAGGGLEGLQPDGVVDGTDFVAFVNSFAIGDVDIDPIADIAGGETPGIPGDGTIDGTDFVAFINAFALGC